MKKYCIYLRVSTKKQGKSTLGLDAQKERCVQYINTVNGEVAAEYKDIESGTHRDRVGLRNAIEFCLKNDATLVVAKLDRLARDVEFCFKVVNTGIEIHFCDMPAINTLLLGVFASVAQYERELTSTRTKDALAVKKAKGAKLGAANEIYIENRKHKDRKEILMEARKRGETKRLRYQQSRDVQAFLKILQHEFPSSTDFDSPSDWVWEDINTKNGKKHSIISLMKTAKELDETGKLFTKWDFTKDDRALLCKLCSYLATIKSTFKKNNI